MKSVILSFFLLTSTLSFSLEADAISPNKQGNPFGLSQEIQALLEDQIAKEMGGALFYLQQSVYMEEVGLTGLASYLKNHYIEELSHANYILNYLFLRRAPFSLRSIIIPAAVEESKNPSAVFRRLLHEETKSTQRINYILQRASSTGDMTSVFFLLKLAAQQISEEYQVGRIAKRLTLASYKPGAILLIDQELQIRSHSPHFE